MLRSALLFLAGTSLLAAQSNPPPAAAAPAGEVLQVPEPGRFKPLFQPFRTDNAAISPDGHYLAYSVREGEKLHVVVLAIDHPEKLTASVQVADDEGATPMLAPDQAERNPARITWLGWTSPTHVVVETNRLLPQSVGEDWVNWRGEILGFDFDGGHAKVLMTPKDTDEFSSQGSSAPPKAEVLPSLTGRPGDLLTSRTPDASRPTDENFSSNGANMPAPQESPPNTPALPQPDVRLVAQEHDGSHKRRTVQLLDYDRNRPGSVLVVVTAAAADAVGQNQVALYSLDGMTGKLQPADDTLVATTLDWLPDRQGRLRLTVPNSAQAGYPLHYEYLGSKGTDQPKALDDVTGLTGFSVSPANYFGERAIPLGFDDDPDVLYYAANTGRDTFGVYSWNFATHQRGRLTLENPAYDLVAATDSGFPARNLLVFDRFKHQLAGLRYDGALATTAWLRPEWQEMQAGFEHAFPGRAVKISDWDESGRRLVVSTEGPADPGAFYIYDGGTKKLTEFVRRAPWIDAAKANPTTAFAFEGPDGLRYSGLITAPRQPRLRPVPMVVLCPDLPWQRVRSDFQAEVQALADMGFVVVQPNGRGTWGFGQKQRAALTAGYDEAEVADIVTIVTTLGQRFQVNSGRIALLGRGHGGFIALRALQAHPDKFRCAIALDAPVNLGDWIAEQRWKGGDVQPLLTRAWLGDAARLQAAPLTANPRGITKPIMMLNYPGPKGGDHRAAYSAARQFAGQVRDSGGSVEFGPLTTDYMNGLPGARAAVFDRIEEFLNIHIYDFHVKLDELQIKK